jgi:alpha-galactosidase
MTEESGKVGMRPDQTYVRDNDRVDVLAKPLADGSVAISFINVSQNDKTEETAVDVALILQYLGEKMADRDAFAKAKSFTVKDLWTGEMTVNETGRFAVSRLEACDNVTVKVTPNA